ncbi:hypothetical protein PSPO01_09801 [Paraphaeosphaeria sporulosa]
MASSLRRSRSIPRLELRECLGNATMVLCLFGVHGTLLYRATLFKHLLREYCATHTSAPQIKRHRQCSPTRSWWISVLHSARQSLRHRLHLSWRSLAVNATARRWKAHFRAV